MKRVSGVGGLQGRRRMFSFMNIRLLQRWTGDTVSPTPRLIRVCKVRRDGVVETDCVRSRWRYQCSRKNGRLSSKSRTAREVQRNFAVEAISADVIYWSVVLAVKVHVTRGYFRNKTSSIHDGEVSCSNQDLTSVDADQPLGDRLVTAGRGALRGREKDR